MPPRPPVSPNPSVPQRSTNPCVPGPVMGDVPGPVMGDVGDVQGPVTRLPSLRSRPRPRPRSTLSSNSYFESDFLYGDPPPPRWAQPNPPLPPAAPPARPPALVHIHPLPEELPEGFGYAPTVEQLRAQALRTPLDLSGRDSYPPWTCPNCNTLNEQVVCLLATLPPLECTACHEQNNVAFDFNITRVKLNGIDISTPVLDQKSEGKCSLFATLGCSNLHQTLRGAKAKISDTQQLSKEDLEKAYAGVSGCLYKKEQADQRGRHRQWRMFQALKRGVSYDSNIPNTVSNRPKFKAKKIWMAEKTNFNHICQLVANGLPMVSSIVGGKNLGDYVPTDVYKAPSLSNVKRGGYVSHAIVICGGGARPRVAGGVPRRHLWIRNAFSVKWGDRGDGMIRASDLIRDPIGMTL